MEQDDIIRGYRKYKNKPFTIEAKYTYSDSWASENHVMVIYKKHHPTKIAAETALELLMKDDKEYMCIYSKINYTIIDERTNKIITTMVVE